MSKQQPNYISSDSFIAYYNESIKRYITKIVIDKKNLFLCLNESEFKENFDLLKSESIFLEPRCVILKYIVLCLGIVAIISTLHLFFSNNNDVQLNNNSLSGAFWFSLFWLILNIYLHETAHIKALKILGGQTKGIRFRMTLYIFPTFFVDTSDSYLFTKIDRIIVYIIGIIINAVLSLILYLFISVFNIPSLYLGFEVVVIPILFNLIPLLNSDGYNILLALIDVYPFENNNKNTKLIKLLKYATLFAKFLLILAIIRTLLF